MWRASFCRGAADDDEDVEDGRADDGAHTRAAALRRREEQADQSGKHLGLFGKRYGVRGDVAVGARVGVRP